MRLTLLVSLLSVAAIVGRSEEPFRCDTSERHAAELRREWRDRERQAETRKREALPEVAVHGNVILVPNDDTMSPDIRSFNLKGKSITFTRTGPDSFSSVTGPLVYDDDRGTQLTLDKATLSAAYTISGFDFPFFGSTRRTLHVSRLLAIYLDTPPAPGTIRQYSDAELLLQTTPVIAPLLTTTLGQTSFRAPAVFVKETADFVVVTWYEANRPVEIQAVLFRNGDIRFSYRSIGNTRGGALYISSGVEAWRAPALIGSATDGTSDFITSNPPAIAAMLDITSASVSRIASTNLVQFVITTREPIDRALIGPGQWIGLQLDLGGNGFVSVSISGNGESGDLLVAPYLSLRGPTALLRVEGDSITVTFAQETALRDRPSDARLQVMLANQAGGDTASIDARIEVPSRTVRTDFGVRTEVPALDGPISDAFTVTTSNVFAAWERARVALDLDPTALDGFVTFQNFQTLGSPASSVGNAGVDGISTFSGISSSLPREPNLFDMHTIREFWNSSDDNAALVMLHEWGHRWMFFIEHLENGASTAVLKDNGHPAVFVDTRAAFPVVNPDDCSVMGGSTFNDNLDGTFTVDEDLSRASYSWLDLYLMGLAPPDEIPDFFYLTDSDPPIEEAPFVEGQTFRATRRNVSIENVTDRMGARKPAFPATQRRFKVFFALVYDPAQPLPAEDIELVSHYAKLFEASFAKATGNRASVTTSLTDPPRRRPARK